MNANNLMRHAEVLRERLREVGVEGIAALSKVVVEEFAGKAPERCPRGQEAVLAGLAYSEFLSTTSAHEDLVHAYALQQALFGIMGIEPAEFRAAMASFGYAMAAT
jgi:hypothetical protein